MVRAAVRRIIAAAVVLRQLPTRAQHTAAMSTPTIAKQASATKRLGLAGVRHAIAVASGKGGVGKSTVAANIAVAMATRLGWRVGLLDADVHGPSLPTMMSLQGEPAVSPEGLMLPQENHRVRCMSMGFFMQGDSPAVWRGPMVSSAIDRMLLGTDWGQLDVLVVDMPPGTGDAQIGLGQRLPLSGAVVVSTPQDVALIDARRGAQMFRKVRVPLLGLVENMSHYHCPACGHMDDIFGAGGGAAVAGELGLELLGQVPLDGAVRAQGDAGTPIVLAAPDSAAARAYVGISARVKAILEEQDSASSESGPGPPTITSSDEGRAR